MKERITGKCKDCGCDEQFHSEDTSSLMPCVECRDCHGFVAKRSGKSNAKAILAISFLLMTDDMQQEFIDIIDGVKDEK